LISRGKFFTALRGKDGKSGDRQKGNEEKTKKTNPEKGERSRVKGLRELTTPVTAHLRREKI